MSIGQTDKSLNTGNQDQLEIQKFDQGNSQWWDEKGPLKTLHLINPARMKFIQQHADLTDKQILDVGCGGGILSESLAKEGAHVTGIDLNKSAINTANSHAAKESLENINYHLCATEDYARQHQNSFDIITCMEMLEHVPEPESIIHATSSMLKPGGLIFFATLNRTVPAYIKAVLGAEHILKLLPKGTHDYAKFLKPSELVHSCRQARLEIKALTGLGFIPFIERAYLSKQLDTNYMLCAKKPTQ